MAASATARAHANLAFVKYWGKADSAINLPLNGSISMNLSGAVTQTSVSFDEHLAADQVQIALASGNASAQLALPFGETTTTASPGFSQRVIRQLDRLRTLAGVRMRARVVTANSFPAGAGIASSASGLAALTVAAAGALGLTLTERELSVLARLGSGSAARSIPAGFVEWLPGTTSDDSYALQIAPPEHWQLADLAVIVSHETKKISSSEGHQLALGSPFSQTRMATIPARLAAIRQAILERDFDRFGQETEAEALSMHAIAMTSAHMLGNAWQSGVYYWLPDTIELLAAVQQWRADGLPVYFTLDAGPTVHLLCPAEYASSVAEAVTVLASEREGRVWTILQNLPAPGAQIIPE